MRQVSAGLRTSRGPQKSDNEDIAAISGLILSQDFGTGVLVQLPAGAPAVVLLADGMGGHAAGRMASSLVTEQLSGDDRLLSPAARSIEEAVIEAHNAVYAAAQTDTALAGMGSTIVGICIPPTGSAIAFNVGDSRLLVQDADVGVVQFSVDDAARTGTGTRSELTQCLGGTLERVQIAPHTTSLELRSRDRLLLCSDGLTDVLGHDDIAEQLARDDPISEVAHNLVESARRIGAEDDVTVVVVDISDVA